MEGRCQSPIAQHLHREVLLNCWAGAGWGSQGVGPQRGEQGPSYPIVSASLGPALCLRLTLGSLLVVLVGRWDVDLAFLIAEPVPSPLSSLQFISFGVTGSCAQGLLPMWCW